MTVREVFRVTARLSTSTAMSPNHLISGHPGSRRPSGAIWYPTFSGMRTRSRTVGSSVRASSPPLRRRQWLDGRSLSQFSAND